MQEAQSNEPKTQAGKRTIDLPEFFIDMLKAHKVKQEERRIKVGEAWEGRDLVFPDLTGGYLNPIHVLRMFKKILERAELPHMHFHDLRHSAATILISMGINPKVIQVHKALRQADKGQICDPTLIGSLDDQILDQIAIDWFTVVGIGGMDIPWLASTGQSCFLHHPFHPFVVDLPPLPLKSLGHATIPIASKVVAQISQRLAKRLIAIILDRTTSMPIIPLPIDVEQPTQPAY